VKPPLFAALLLFASILRICEAQVAPCAGLQSQFLKDDPTAQAIASGTLTNYSIDQFTLRSGDPLPGARTDVFAYSVLTAIRELGYLPGPQTAYGEDVGAELLNKFQRLNGLAESPIITAATLLALDAAMARMEMLDQEAAQDFPLYSIIPEAPPNEPSRTHLAALLDAEFRALPACLRLWNTRNFFWYASTQLSGSIITDASGDRFCSSIYYTFSPDSCTIIGTVTTLQDDFTAGADYLHEYAHYLDQNIFGLLQSPDSSAGVINTTDFYAISYDINDSMTLPNGWTSYRMRRDVTTSGGAEFVSNYAVGWGSGSYLTAYEDFAESFGLYVTGGSVFRELGRQHVYLQQKYDWLKQNVFEGIEYNTGSLTGMANLQMSPVGSSYGIAVFNVVQYLLADPDAVWMHDFPRYPAAPQPPRLRMRPVGRPAPGCEAKW